MAQSDLKGEGGSVSFSDRAVTAWDGLALLKQMLDSLGLRQVTLDVDSTVITRNVG